MLSLAGARASSWTSPPFPPRNPGGGGCVVDSIKGAPVGRLFLSFLPLLLPTGPPPPLSLPPTIEAGTNNKQSNNVTVIMTMMMTVTGQGSFLRQGSRLDPSQHQNELVHIRIKDQNKGLRKAKVDQHSRNTQYQDNKHTAKEEKEQTQV
ncbi:hypothetical protein SUGI_0682810 [Cryptomeria japonica]|nr:hypothetical protein SUGI_0682810 [Cryptomeria japonica]